MNSVSLSALTTDSVDKVASKSSDVIVVNLCSVGADKRFLSIDHRFSWLDCPKFSDIIVIDLCWCWRFCQSRVCCWPSSRCHSHDRYTLEWNATLKPLMSICLTTVRWLLELTRCFFAVVNERLQMWCEFLVSSRIKMDLMQRDFQDSSVWY